MDSSRARAFGGTLLVVGGVLTILGFVTAEVLYPGYSAADQTISALGAADAPAAPQVVFNGTMIVTGLAMAFVAVLLHTVYGRVLLTGIVAAAGVGVVGVGVFPSQTGAPHFVAAMVAFAGLGCAALAAAATVRGPMRYVSVALGVSELLALVLFVALGDGTPLGIGGIERWVAYLGVAWVLAFGGYLLGGADAS
ncbi:MULTISPECIES: DUF998 domain-containing protein [Halobacterium]|uniref:DUF998 domain-containing protein n=1 Tax=Halobacterium TaxID=2239 RepID=UPI00073EF8B4|nr:MULTISPECIES: DUF998 domain-containing protein [Halobacterium]MCG1003867.1 DUF998 domain-containing protein [Halobacterium noricense]